MSGFRKGVQQLSALQIKSCAPSCVKPIRAYHPLMSKTSFTFGPWVVHQKKIEAIAPARNGMCVFFRNTVTREISCGKQTIKECDTHIEAVYIPPTQISAHASTLLKANAAMSPDLQVEAMKALGWEPLGPILTKYPRVYQNDVRMLPGKVSLYSDMGYVQVLDKEAFYAKLQDISDSRVAERAERAINNTVG